MILSRNITALTLFSLIALATAPVFSADDGISVPTSDKPAMVTTTEVVVTSPTWADEDAYWVRTYETRPYYKKTVTYKTYEPAYKYGYELYDSSNDVPFDDLDIAELQAKWNALNTDATITWDQALPAVRDSYTRVYEYHHTPSATVPAAGTIVLSPPTKTVTKTTIIEKTTK